MLINIKKYLLVNNYFGKPSFIDFIGKVKGLAILDLGCGTGHITRDLAKMRGKCIGVDKSEVMIEMAKKAELIENCGVKYYCLDGIDLKGIRSNSFDIVILFQVFMNISKENEIRKIFEEVQRVLKSKGEIIFSLFHPALIKNYKDNFREIILPKNYSYFNNEIHYKAKHLLTDYDWMEFTNTHWTFEFMYNMLKENNFIIEEIKEPIPKKDKYWKYFKSILHTPHYMFIKAVKKS